MTEQEWNDEQAWIAGQGDKLDYIQLCHSHFHWDETETLLEMGFDVVCLADKVNMKALEPLTASCLKGEGEAFIARKRAEGDETSYVLLSMSRNDPIEWYF